MSRGKRFLIPRSLRGDDGQLARLEKPGAEGEAGSCSCLQPLSIENMTAKFSFSMSNGGWQDGCAYEKRPPPKQRVLVKQLSHTMDAGFLLTSKDKPLHTAKALREELYVCGFDTATVHGVMGGAWLAPNLDELLANEETKTVLMKTVRMLDTHEEIIGLSGHLLAVSRKA